MTVKRKPVSRARGAVTARCRQGARWSRAGLRHEARGGRGARGCGRKGRSPRGHRLEAGAPGRGARGAAGTRRPTVPVPAASQIRSPPVETPRRSVYSAELGWASCGPPQGRCPPRPERPKPRPRPLKPRCPARPWAAPALLCASAVPSWLTSGPPALRCALSTQQPERGQNPGPILSLRGWNPLKLESPAVAARPVCPHPRPVRPPLLSPLQTLCAPSTPAMSAWIGLCSQIPVGQKPRPAH